MENGATGVRQNILIFLKQEGQATVIELARTLGLAPVSVRHHLDILLNQGLIRMDGVLRRPSRGRPRHIYVLTPAADGYFPNGYQDLARRLLKEMKTRMSQEQVAAFFEQLAEDSASQMQRVTGQSAEERLTQVAETLSDQGYLARWEKRDQRYILHVFNCPFGALPEEHEELCQMDMLLISRLLNQTPLRVAHVIVGDRCCSYAIEA